MVLWIGMKQPADPSHATGVPTIDRFLYLYQQNFGEYRSIPMTILKVIYGISDSQNLSSSVRSSIYAASSVYGIAYIAEAGAMRFMPYAAMRGSL